MGANENTVGTRRRAVVRAATVLALVAGCMALALAPAGKHTDQSAQGAAARGPMLDAAPVASRTESGPLGQAEPAQGPEMRWQPVSATGSYTVIGNDINLDGGGQEVTLEIHLSGWGQAPGQPELAAYQGTLDSTGYSSGTGDPLSATGASIDQNRTDYVFYGLESFYAVNTAIPDYQWGSVLIMPPFKADGGGIYYGGTLTLDVPPDAAGTYTIEYQPADTQTFMNDPAGLQIPGLILVPGTITVKSPQQPQACCMLDGTCIDTTRADCRLQDGAPMGSGSSCDQPNVCKVAEEACEPWVCGPGNHWVDNCLEDYDRMSTAGLVGLDLDGDCVADPGLSFVMSGPVTIHHADRSDDSARYPGLRPVDGHLDVKDTEIVQMYLSKGGVVMRAGALGGQGGVLVPSYGAVAEELQPPGDPALADSFFDVFVEVTGDGLPGPVYNHQAIQVATTIDCMPPMAGYIHVTGCIALYDNPTPGQGNIVAWLVQPDHFTFPAPGACCFADGSCVDGTTPDWCSDIGGDWKGPGTDCATVVCEGAPQACCLLDGTCIDTTRADCRLQDGAPMGPGSSCADPGVCNVATEACEPWLCGPGNHWVDNCLEDYDRMSTAGLVGLDLDGDCIADLSFVMSGPVTIHHGDPSDDSARYPGLRPVDGHLDVKETEIVQMYLSKGGVVMRAGALGGLGGMLAPSYGAVAEEYPQPPGVPNLADSFFDVFVEVTGDVLPGPIYNHQAIQVATTIDCMPPMAGYIHVTGCIALYDNPTPGQGNIVAWLVQPDHFTFPTGACCLADGSCVDGMTPDWCSDQGGDWNGPGTACLGDPDGDGVVDPCDNCPSEYNPDQNNSDEGGQAFYEPFTGTVINDNVWVYDHPELWSQSDALFYSTTSSQRPYFRTQNQTVSVGQTVRMKINLISVYDHGGGTSFTCHLYLKNGLGWPRTGNSYVLSFNGPWQGGGIRAYTFTGSSTPTQDVQVVSTFTYGTDYIFEIERMVGGVTVRVFDMDETLLGEQQLSGHSDDLEMHVGLGAADDAREAVFDDVQVLGTDGDSLGDACDNCWYVGNPDQSDSDCDCPDPPYVSDPLCGDACDPPREGVVCEPQGGDNPTHPSTYWYRVSHGGFCDFHVRVFDSDSTKYSNWVAPDNWVTAVHQVGDEWWASWWDPTPNCQYAIFDCFTFSFDNDSPSAWGDWSITTSNSSDPYLGVADSSDNHSAEEDGYGYRVHVPMGCPVEEGVVCEPQGGGNPTHPTDYWYEVTYGGFCDYHVRVFDPNSGNYTNWVAPANWVTAVHQVGEEWWASWWDPTPNCQYAIFDCFTFGFDNDYAATWGDWSITQGNSDDPYYMVADSSGNHTGEQDGYGYRVHVPLGAMQACCMMDGRCVDTSVEDCVSHTGDPQGPDTSCDSTVCSPAKWSQPPQFFDASLFPDCFWGWDEVSIYGQDPLVGPILMDDWWCTTERPVSDIHWWGSYAGWYAPLLPNPPQVAPDAFHIGIWSDIGLWHPDALIWEWIVPRGELNERNVGCDFHSGMPHDMTGRDSCYRYDFDIPEPDWFYQDDSCNKYWLSISAIYEGMCACNGDVNDDGVITGPDGFYVALCANIGDCSYCVNSCDINCDGTVDAGDVDAVNCLIQGNPPEQCCPGPGIPYPWGWKTQPAHIGWSLVRMTLPYVPLIYDLFDDGNHIDFWDMSFVVTTTAAFQRPDPPPPPHDSRKHRYLSIDPTTNPQTPTVIKVEIAEMKRCQNDPRRGCLVDLDCRDVCGDEPNTLCPTGPGVCGGGNCIDSGPCVDATPNPPIAWLVQEPQQIRDGCLAPGCNPADENCCGDEDWVARLSNVPYADPNNWQDHNLIHISDCGIVPGVTYNVYACDPANTDICSEPLAVGTQATPSGTHLHFGDIAGAPLFSGAPYEPPDGFVNVVDVSAWGLTKQNYGTPNPPQLHPTMADLHGTGYGVPANYILGLSDQQAIINHGFTWALPWDNPTMLGGVDPSTCPGRLP